jgi:hypothetical protein
MSNVILRKDLVLTWMALFIVIQPTYLKPYYKNNLQNVFTIITFVNDDEKMLRSNINLAISGI